MAGFGSSVRDQTFYVNYKKVKTNLSNMYTYTGLSTLIYTNTYYIYNTRDCLAFSYEL